MKKIMISLILAAIFLTSGEVFAARPHFSVFLAPPRVWIGPPVYAPAPGYYYGPHRVWIPGHWDRRWTPYGPERVWIRGYYQYR